MKKHSLNICEIDLITEFANQIKVRLPDVNIYKLTTIELTTIRNVSQTFCKRNILGLIPNEIEDFHFAQIIRYEDELILFVVDIINGVVLRHETLLKILKWARPRYGIEILGTTDPQTQNGVKIFKLELGLPSVDIPLYKSIKELKTKSKLYKSLDNKTKQKIFKPSNILKIVDTLATKNRNHETIKFIEHLFHGSLKGHNFTGIHHITPIISGVARIVEIIHMPNSLGIWEAKIQKLDNRNSQKKWKDKLQSSTFFPVDWDQLKLLDECEFALSKKEFATKKFDNKKYTSNTKSGIPVEIWTNSDDKLISIYPIFEKN